MNKLKQIFKSSALSMTVMLLMVLGMSVTALADAPSGLRQTDDSTTSVKVEFTGVAGAAYYGYEIATDASFAEASIVKRNYSSASYNSAIPINALTAGSTFYIRIGYGSTKENCYANWSDTLEVVTRPNSMTDVKFIDAGDTTATVGWEPAPGANCYIVNYNDVEYTTDATSYTLTFVTGKTSAIVTPCRASASGYIAKGSNKRSPFTMTSLTQKISKDNFGFRNAWTSINNFQIRASYNGHGMEVQVYDVKSNKKKFSDTAKGTSDAYVSFNKKFKRNNMYKYRVRAYAVTTDGTTLYGQWSDFRYFVNPELPAMKVVGKTIKMNWAKIKGLSKIKIQISTKEKSGYKTCATLTNKKNAYTITKCGKKKLKKGVYFIRVYYYTKDGKKTYESDIWMYGKAQIR